MAEILSINEAIEALKDDDVANRKLAIASLENVNDEAIIEPLIEATKDENAQIRFKAAEILGNMGDVAVDKLIKNLQNQKERIRDFWHLHLRKLKTKRSFLTLLKRRMMLHIW